MTDEKNPLQVLILEDRPSDAELMLYELRKEGFQPDWVRVDNQTDFIQNLDQEWDIILSDYTMPQFTAHHALEIIQEREIEIPFVVVTGDIGEEVAVQMIKNGAADYLLKDRLTRLGTAVRNAIQDYHTALEKKRAEQQLVESETKYRELIENLNDIVYSISPDGVVTFIGSPITALSGFHPGEITGKDFRSFIHPEDQNRVEEALQRTLNGTIQPEEFRIKTADNDYRWVRTSSRVMKKDDTITGLQGVLTDIHDQVTTQQKLIDREIRYQTIFNNTGTIMVILEEDTTISMINDYTKNLTGYSREEIINKMSWTDLVSETDRKKMKHYHRLRREDPSQAPSSYPVKLKRKDGSELPVIVSVEVIPGTNQSIASILDISSQVELQEQIEVSEQKYRGIFEGVQDAVFVEDAAGNILDVNQRACDMFGYQREEFLELDVRDIVAENGVIINREKLIAQGGFLENMESINIRKNGDQFPVEISAQIQTINNQELIIIVLRDITARKETESALQRQLKELTALHSIANMGTMETDEEKIIAHATRVIGNSLDPDFFGILMADPSQEYLLVSPTYQNIPPNYPLKPVPFGEGVAGEVAATGIPQNHPDVSQLENFISVFPDIRSELCVPIQSKDQVLGVINVESTVPSAFDDNDERLLLTLARQLATAIERSRLFNTVGRQIDRLQTLRTIDRAISSSLDLNVTLNIILDQTSAQLEVDGINILLLEPDTQTLVVKASKGFQKVTPELSSIQIGAGLAGKVALENNPLQVTDYHKLQSQFRDPDQLDERQFQSYYALPLTFKGKTQGVLELFHETPQFLDQEWKGFAATLANQAAIAIDNAEMFENIQRVNLELTRAYDTTLSGWARALEMRDHETEGHSQRVTELTLKLASRMGVAPEKMADIRRGTLLHDIGKIAIPDSILLKPGKLTPQEWEIIRQHPVYARQMLEPISYLSEAMEIPVYHHEWWNGEGYPEGLKEHEIPLSARIFSIIDVWDALTNDRPYRDAWEKEQAYQYLEKQSGTQFDPQVVEVFLSMLDDLDLV